MLTDRTDQLIEDAQRAIYIHDGVLALKAERDQLRGENTLLRSELDAVKVAWRDLWEKAGCPAGRPE
jgi:cell wall assembly regulator SMI1